MTSKVATPPFQDGRCKACGREIYWVMLSSTGNLAPLETTRRTVITREGATVSGYESHFAYCPQAGLFRGGKGKE